MTVMPSAIVVSGLMRKRKWLGAPARVGKIRGARRKRTTTSVQVTGSDLPARM